MSKPKPQPVARLNPAMVWDATIAQRIRAALCPMCDQEPPVWRDRQWFHGRALAVCACPAAVHEIVGTPRGKV